MAPAQPQQFRFSQFVWRFLRNGEIEVADISELDDAMREAITNVRQAKTPEDLSHLEQFFVVSDWNGNNVILASATRRPSPIAMSSADDGKNCGLGSSCHRSPRSIPISTPCSTPRSFPCSARSSLSASSAAIPSSQSIR
jgi:hypothetical protein